MGTQGDVGPQGPQGIQGPQGAVLVIDGGVVTGPPGASVIITPITAGGAVCPFGGARVTQLSDGGITNVCNGQPGVQGDTGPQGPQGPIGMTGPQGAQGMTGAQGAQGVAGPIGMTGPQGAQGMTGAAGPQGPMGPAGPAGPPGAVLYLDGGVVLSGNPIVFVGFTAATYNGNLGGQAGANAKCSAEFTNSYFCTLGEYDQSNTTVAPGGVGAWIDYDRKPTGARETSSCTSGLGTWSTTSASSYGANLTANGSFYTSVNCSNMKPLACCRGGAPKVVFRGFTAMTYNGNLGGQVGANAKCAAEFSGSYFCSLGEYDSTNTPSAPGGVGAWIDYDRKTTGARETSSCTSGLGTWSTTSSSSYGANITSNGSFYTSVNCSNLKPLTCCGNL